MKIANNLHAFVWESMTANNCNAYLIDGPTRVLIDPGHRALFEHVELGLRDLKLTTDDIDLVICTHAHPDHLEGVQLFKQKSTLFTLNEIEWNWVITTGKQMSAAFGIDTEDLTPDFFLKEGTLSLDGLNLEVFLTPGHSPGSIRRPPSHQDPRHPRTRRRPATARRCSCRARARRPWLRRPRLSPCGGPWACHRTAARRCSCNPDCRTPG